jgi:hypothetical protein
MSALTILRPAPALLTRLSPRTIRGIAVGTLIAIATGLAALLSSPHDPTECRYGEPPHVEVPGAPNLMPYMAAQIVSTPTFAAPSSLCPRAPQH